MKLKNCIGKYVIVDYNDEVYEGKLVYYDDSYIYVEIDGENKAFLGEDCEIAVYDDYQVEEAQMTRKMVELRKAGRFIVDYGDTEH